MDNVTKMQVAADKAVAKQMNIENGTLNTISYITSPETAHLGKEGDHVVSANRNLRLERAKEPT